MTTGRRLESTDLIWMDIPRGKEYADHHPRLKAREARSAAKPHSVIASRGHHSPARHPRTKRALSGSAKLRTETDKISTDLLISRHLTPSVAYHFLP